MSSFEALPDLAWVSIMFDFPEVPLLCKEGLGEVEAWRKHVAQHRKDVREDQLSRNRKKEKEGKPQEKPRRTPPLKVATPVTQAKRRTLQSDHTEWMVLVCQPSHV